MNTCEECEKRGCVYCVDCWKMIEKHAEHTLQRICINCRTSIVVKAVLCDKCYALKIPAKKLTNKYRLVDLYYLL